MLDIMQLRFDCKGLGSILQNIVDKVLIVVDLVDELVYAWRRLRSAAFYRLWADNLAIIYNQLLVNRCCRSQCCLFIEA